MKDKEITATVSNVTPTGFTVTISEAVDGLVATNFALDKGGNVTDATTADNGATHTITTDTLTEGVTYSLTVTARG